MVHGLSPGTVTDAHRLAGGGTPRQHGAWSTPASPSRKLEGSLPKPQALSPPVPGAALSPLVPLSSRTLAHWACAAPCL